MEFGNELLLTLKEEPLEVFDKTAFQWILPRKNPGFEQLVNFLGQAAVNDKKLKKPITTLARFIDSSDEQLKLFILWEKRDEIPVVHGFVKTSRKQLYLRDIDQQPYIVTPLSFIDYYFVDGNKEKAVQLIDLIIKKENTTIQECAFDNPSGWLLSLLKDHYQLSGPVEQSIKFTVFEAFFDGLTPESEISVSKFGSRATSGRQSPILYSHRASDTVGDLIHHRIKDQAPTRAAPDTPQGRKFTRDFGHQSIW